MTEKIQNREIKPIFLKMVIITLIMLIAVSIFSFSLKNISSLLLGAIISFVNMLWLQKIILSLASDKKITKKTGISMGLKVIFIFGGITIIILKTKINILIFLFGLSILPVVVFFDSFIMIIKTFGGMDNGSSRT
jgi:hypothetical protein